MSALKLHRAIICAASSLCMCCADDASYEHTSADVGGDLFGRDADIYDVHAEDTPHEHDAALSDVSVAPSPLTWWLEDRVDSPRLAAWLRARRYVSWESSSRVTPSDQGGSRVFLNPALARALRDGALFFPVGSVAVREIYFDDLITPKVFNLLIKLDDSAEQSADNWHWFEIPADGISPATTDQRNASGCVACHSAKPRVLDAIQSVWPLP